MIPVHHSGGPLGLTLTLILTLTLTLTPGMADWNPIAKYFCNEIN